MGTSLAPEGESENESEVDLFQRVSQTFRQMAEIARNIDVHEEEKIFYSHLALHCMRFEVCLERARPVSSRFNGDVIDRALSCLYSLLLETGFHELPYHKLRLQDLYASWEKTRKQEHNAQVIFVARWMKLGSPEDHLNRIDEGLEDCADILEKQQKQQQQQRRQQQQQPENVLKKQSHDVLSASNYEPSYVVWKAAQALFEALQKCKGCSCSKQHEFGAKLEMGTYRRPVKKTDKSLNTRSNPSVMRCRDVDATRMLDLEMFLSMEHKWHEIRVQTVKERVVGFAMDGHAPPSLEAHKAKVVENLCKSIDSTKSTAWQRLVLKLKKGQLFNERVEKTNFWIDKSAEPISLLKCFEERREFFTEKTKRILSLIIGYAVLHLNRTSWLQPGWGSANIKFFQTTTRKTPLRPFIQVDLPEAGTTTDVEPGSADKDEASFEDLDAGHPCPALIALAIVLIEVYFAKPFTKLAQMSGIPLESSSGHITLVDVCQVFNGEDENEIEGWRSQIPEDSPLLKAIDNCLDTARWEDEEGDPLDNEAMKSQIYQDVVWPLELHLTSGFSSIPLDNVDDYARQLDFGQWGQIINDQESQTVTSTLPQESLIHQRSPSPAVMLLDSGQLGVQLGPPALQKLLHQISMANSFASSSHSLKSLSSFSSYEPNYRASQFFDDEVGDGGYSNAKTKDYIKWRSEYENVYDKCIRAYLSDPPSRPMKIAILDTGIDRDHDAFEAREENIKAKLNFYNNSQRSIPDLNGHGTFTASLILDYAPDAELYIAKIADKENATPNAKIVVNAINHAIDKWNVDIISLSFGWPSTNFEGYDELEDAIDRAHGKKILIFAAASNSGGKLGRAYPASSSQVICVHSTDTLGTPSGFSPTAEPDNLNFATVGESIESAWPMLLCNDTTTPQRYVKSRSGTSYATPIMAGIAAFLLQYARLHLPERAASALKRKEKMEALLKRCAKRGPNYAPRGNYYYVELSLHQHNLFGRELDRINDEILETLKR
ncbi:peptidase S8/S53 domain-containing protein [Trichoderma sp. SZMC 28012]